MCRELVKLTPREIADGSVTAYFGTKKHVEAAAVSSALAILEREFHEERFELQMQIKALEARLQHAGARAGLS